MENELAGTLRARPAARRRATSRGGSRERDRDLEGYPGEVMPLSLG
jgi:hypothetical protein